MQKIIHKDIKIITDSGVKDFSDIEKDSFLFAKNAMNLDEIVSIYIKDSYNFLVAFFGCLMAYKEVLVLGRETNDFCICDENFSSFLKPSQKQVDCNIDINRIFYIQTSGTSTSNKNIAKTINQMLIEANLLKNKFNISQNHTFFGSISHQHLYGLSFKIFLPLVSGAIIDSQTISHIEYIEQYIRNNNANNLILVTSPTVLNMIAKQDNIEYLGLLKILFSAGSKIDSNANKVLQKNAKNIVEIYGSTETGVIASSENGVLVAFDGVKLSLDSKERLIIESDWQKNILNPTAFVSNDCAILNDGVITLLGRYDRVIKLHDKRISLDYIESKLKESRALKNAFVFLEDGQNHLSALIQLNDFGKEMFRNGGKNAIINDLSRSLQIDKIIRLYYICYSIPYNAQGKITKLDLQNCIKNRVEPELTIETREQNKITAKALVQEDCFYFNGHFRDFPLIPGFIELGFVYKLIDSCWGIPYNVIKEVENIKFIQFLRPLDYLKIEIDKNQNKIYFRILANNTECANGRLSLNS